MRDFEQVVWDAALEADVDALLALALREDLGTAADVTTLALIPADARGGADVRARGPGIVCGLPAAQRAARAVDPQLQWTSRARDGQPVECRDTVGRLAGPARSILAAERLVLNLLGRLSGIATLAAQYVRAVAGTKARIYDTRKTTPGWRRLEKYAVRCGGGCNHRTGLFDAILIKDNHLVLMSGDTAGGQTSSPAEAVKQARAWLASKRLGAEAPATIVEIEVDTLQQLAEVLPAGPDIVLLDNMTPAQLREAVARRNAAAPQVELEASGGVNLETVAAIAASGVERISVGALTHGAVSLDFGLDWNT